MLNPFLKPHLRKIGMSATLALNNYQQVLLGQGKKVYKFGFGASPFPVHHSMVNALKENAHQKDYLPTAGLLKLREKVAESYNHTHGSTYNANNVIIGPGSKELMFLMQYVVNDVDTLIQSPSWVSYKNQATVLNIETTTVQSTYENKYKITPSDLKGLVTPDKNQIAQVNSPGNPTGQIYSDMELKALAEVLDVERTIVHADEIYADLSFDPQCSKPTVSKYLKERTVITSAISKCHGAGGWRLGYAIIPDELEELQSVILKVASETYSAVAAPIQHASVEGYEIKNVDLDNYKLDQSRILKTVGEWSYSRLKEHGVKLHQPQAGFYLFPDFSNFKEAIDQKLGAKSSIEFCEILLEQTGVAVLAGAYFNQSDEIMNARLAFVDINGGECLEYLKKNPNAVLDAEFVEKYAPNVFEGINKMCDWLDKLNE